MKTTLAMKLLSLEKDDLIELTSEEIILLIRFCELSSKIDTLQHAIKVKGDMLIEDIKVAQRSLEGVGKIMGLLDQETIDLFMKYGLAFFKFDEGGE